MMSLRKEVRENFTKYSTRLTPKQEAVINLRAKGLYGVQIAHELQIPQPSVSRMIRAFLEKYECSLGVKKRR